MTAGGQLAVQTLNRTCRGAVIHLVIYLHLAAPATRGLIASISGLNSTVVSVALRLSHLRTRTVFLVRMAIRRTWARRTLASLLLCVSPRAMAPHGEA